MKEMIKLILGALLSKKKHLLVLLQNNNELRATGGFITNLIDIGNYKICSRNVYEEMSQHEKINGPKALVEMLDDDYFQGWSFRDANYYPDFIKSAKYIEKFYKIIFPQNEVIGIIAINFSLIESLLTIRGPIKIDGKQICSNSLFYFLTRAVSDINRHSQEALKNRKNILFALGNKILIKTFLSPLKWLKINNLIQKSFKNRDIQIFSKGKKSARVFSYKTDQDFLAVIDSNFLGLKSNRYLKRSIFQETIIDKNRNAQTELKIIWEHLGEDDFPLSGVYNFFSRIYLPLNTNYLGCESWPETVRPTIQKSKNFCIISFKNKILPKNKAIINIFYSNSVKTDHQIIYKFKFFKQSGVQRETFSKIIHFPPNFLIEPVKTGISTENIYTYDIAALDEDLLIDLKAIKSSNSPRIISHEIISKNKIRITFNEAIQPISAIKSHFKLTNEKEKKTIEINSLDFQNNKIDLMINDLPPIEEKFYELELKNLENYEGIKINPNPRTITVVYRSKFFEIE